MSRKPAFNNTDLTPAERLKLADDLHGIERNDENSTLTHAQRAELDRRFEEYQRDLDDGETWDVVRDEILRDLAADRASAA